MNTSYGRKVVGLLRSLRHPSPKGNAMFRRSLAAFAVVGSIVAIAVPSIASGSAQVAKQAGLVSAATAVAADTPYLATLSGANEVPPADPDGAGTATITLSNTSATEMQVCWNLTFSAIAAPTAAHIHRGAVGANGPVVAAFGTPAASPTTGCAPIASALAAEIIATPAGFYVNVHNTDFPGGAIRGQLAAGPTTTTSIHLLPVPLRAYDSRATGLTRLAGGSTRTIGLVVGKNGAGTTTIAVPPGATGAIVTLTVTGTDGPGGFLKLYSAAVTEPSTSTINWTAVDSDVATTTTVAVDATGQVKVTASSAGTHVIIDVIGYLS
jgi:hypothetical protein